MLYEENGLMIRRTRRERRTAVERRTQRERAATINMLVGVSPGGFFNCRVRGEKERRALAMV